MAECGNCKRWSTAKTHLPNIGVCFFSGKYTAIGFVCDKHEPNGTKARDKAKTVKPFDLDAAANKVITAAASGRIKRVDIVSVQIVLKCSYALAAEVVAYMAETGMVE